MKRWCPCVLLAAICLLAFPYPSPAPLVYRAGEGWTYEPVGSDGKWTRTRAQPQIEVAEAAFASHNYDLALRAARRTQKQWPLSDYAPQAQYLVGRCYEAKGNDERAFKEYQKLLEKYPKVDNYDEVLERQYQIANRYLGGQRFKFLGYIPLLPSMDKTATMYDKIVKNGPYSEVAPKAQMSVGAAREKQSNYPEAVKAYEQAADRYSDREHVSADALFKAGLAYQKQARTAEYDQNAAVLAIAAFNDFITLYPNEPRVGEAQNLIAALKTEQARGSFEIARFYEKRNRPEGALVYYNEVLVKDPASQLAEEARQRIDTLKKRLQSDQ